jgi:hypothetical protein
MKESYKEYQKFVNEEFKEAKGFVEASLGIELTLIELCELKNSVKYTSEIFFQDKIKFLQTKVTDRYQIHPEKEAGFIFMNKNYGVQDYNRGGENGRFFLDKIRLKKEFGYDVHSKFFKKMQDEMHNKFTIY